MYDIIWDYVKYITILDRFAEEWKKNANATSAPGIVDADRNPILTRSEVYSGIYGRASISFYAFNSSGYMETIFIKTFEYPISIRKFYFLKFLVG